MIYPASPHVSLSLNAWRGAQSDDWVRISSCRVPITPVTYRCTIRITNGRCGCFAEVRNQGVIKQQSSQGEGTHRLSYDPPASNPEASPGNVPSVFSEHRAVEAWPHAYLHMPTHTCTCACVRAHSVYEVDTQMHRASAVLENNNWPWLAVDIVLAICLWCECFSCVGGPSTVCFRAKRHHRLYISFPEGSTSTSSSHKMQESALKSAADLHRWNRLWEGESRRLSGESMAAWS